MGGKTKQSQRVKNNARPSSSSRSAELLNNSLSPDGGLMTIGNGKALPALFPTLTAAVNLEQGLSPEYQMCIKKLNKKDPITRTKALQELCELVNNSNVDDAVAALPTWAHHYKTLTTDTDRKVREMTQRCHGALLRASGRRAAPQLRALLPAWLQAQHDEHAPAMTHAMNSLKSTFPDAKLPEVISFCKSEVMAHLVDNLIGNTDAAVSQKAESPDERELHLARVATGSLRGLEYFVPRLPAAHRDWLWAELLPLLDHPAYWKLATHNLHQVRAAWYSATSRVVERFGSQFAERFGLKSMRVLLAAARDRHALAAAPAWACLLALMHHVQDWQKYLDKKDLLVKRILDVLETGGWGDAKHLSSIMLPLLAHLPDDMLTKEFYETFFKAVYSGLDKKNIVNSKSERQAWITSLSECLRYLSIQQKDFVVEVVTSVHRTWLEKMLCLEHDAQTRNNFIKFSATNMTSLVKYWLKQSKEANDDKYDQLLRNFWQNIGSTVVAEIDKCGIDLNELESYINGHILLLQTLKTTFLQETKKQQSIKFEKIDEEESSAVDKSPAVTPQCDASIVERYNHNLNELAYKVIAQYFEAAEKKQLAHAILGPMITLLKEFDSVGVYAALARQCGAGSPYELYERVLRAWLSADTMRCSAVVDVVFLMLQHLREEEQDAVFDSFEQFPPHVTQWCLARSAAHPHVRLRAAGAWARGAAGAAAAAALAARALAHRDRAAAALLWQCLAGAPDGEPLISEAGVSQVVTAINAALESACDALAADAGGADGASLAWSAQLGARLATALAATRAAASPPYAALVRSLLRLTVLVPRGAEPVPLDSWCEARSSWQDALGALPAAARHAALRHAATLLRDRLLSHIEEVDIKKIEHTVSLTPYLFIRGDESQLPADAAEIAAFTELMFDTGAPEALAVETCALRHDCVTSQLNCLYDDNDAMKNILEDSAKHEIKELTKSELSQYVNKFLFRAIYLRTLLLHKVASEDDDDDGDQTTWCDALLRENYLKTEFCRVLHDYMVVNSLHEGYTFWAHYDIIEETKAKLDVLISDVIGATSQALRHDIVTSLSELAAGRGYYWAYAHCHYVRAALREQDARRVYDVGGREIDDVSGNGYFHMLQAYAKLSGDPSLQYRAAYVVMRRAWHLAHPEQSATADALPAELARCSDALDVDVIVNAYYRRQGTMLYETDVRDAAWIHVVSNAAVADFLARMVRERGWDAPAHHWDFTTITLCSLLTSLCHSKDSWASTKVALLSLSVLRLLAAVRQFAGGVRRECERRAPAEHVAALPTEWADIFAPDACASLYTLVAHVLNSSSRRELSVPSAAVLGALIAELPALEWGAVARAPRERELSLRALASAANCALLRPAHPALKHAAHLLLRNLAPAMVDDDSQRIALWSDESAGEGEGEGGKARPALALDHFDSTFKQLHDIVDAALTNIVLGEETCELASLSDSHSLALGWLLLADAQAHVCELARGDLMQFYIQIYRENNYAPALLASALRLLPGDVFAYAYDSNDAAPAPPRHADDFLRVAPFAWRAACAGRGAAALACRGVGGAVAGAGCGAARGWWGALPPRDARALERVVAAYVAPHAVRAQLLDVQRRAPRLADATVRVAWAAAEVACELAVEQSALQMRVWLARAHPLAPPRLVAPSPAGAGTAHWLVLFLAYQNGTIFDALRMWTQAVSARVQRSPQCYICYCRLHPATGRLPCVPCHQCKNKFHKMCLRKWFKTSSKSKCPLCRATF